MGCLTVGCVWILIQTFSGVCCCYCKMFRQLPYVPDRRNARYFRAWSWTSRSLFTICINFIFKRFHKLSWTLFIFTSQSFARNIKLFVFSSRRGGDLLIHRDFVLRKNILKVNSWVELFSFAPTLTNLSIKLMFYELFINEFKASNVIIFQS